MKLVNKNHLQRYKQIALLLWKYGRSDLVQKMGVEEELAEARKAEEPGAVTPDMLADDLEAMGPTYVKLGQVLSGRPDLLPEAYTKALTRLQDDVKPFPFEQVRTIVESELGAKISKAFSRFDPEPIAAASLGQVHAAALRDGREVVVKVQRPDVAKQVAEEFEVLTQIADFLEAHTEVGRRHRITGMLDEIKASILNELDYTREAKNLCAMAGNLAEFELIQVPEPVMDFTTPRVLTMEYVSGRKITSMSPITRMEIDGSVLAEELFRAYLKQVLVDGLFHADPHPGNVFLTDDGRIALLDLGMVGHTTPAMQMNLLKTLIALSEGKSEQAADVIIAMSEQGEAFDAAAFKKRIGQLVAAQQGQSLQDMSIGLTLLDVTRAGADNDLFVPSELTLLAKTLLQLDEVGTTLDPQFDPNAAVRRNVAELMSRRVKKDATQGNFFGSILEIKEFLAGLPARVNRVMDAVGNRELEVKVKAVDADFFMEGLQKVANRVTSGLVLAALIIGAALLMRVDTPFRIFGYPGLAMLLFLFAAGGGAVLLMSIVAQDRRAVRKT